MKLFRFGNRGHEKPGVLLQDGKSVDASSFGEDYDEKFFGTDGPRRLQSWVAQNAHQCPILDPGVRLGPCVARPSKIICVGLNYARHAAESGLDIPKEPVIFLKATSSLCGPNDDVIIPRGSRKTDWEVELAVVVGKRSSYVEIADAMNHVSGYCLHNDYSEREFQLERGGQWVKGKSSDTFAPLGPYLATCDEIETPHRLRLWLKVNGAVQQDSNTSDMIFNVPFLISYITKFMTLLPGDVISTGTPSGVGFGLKPPRYLSHGDVVELGIDGLGSACQRIVSYESRNGSDSLSVAFGDPVHCNTGQFRD